MNIELPRDAEGREIPLDTKVLYDTRGAKRNVQAFMRSVDDGRWMVFFLDFNGSSSPDKMRLTPPDSLKQLAEDLNRVQAKHDANGTLYRESACCYVGRLGATCMCNGCRLNCGDKTCFETMMEDIVSRVNRLCGDAE